MKFVARGISDKTTLYRSGTPFDTDAVVAPRLAPTTGATTQVPPVRQTQSNVGQETVSELPHFEVTQRDGAVILRRRLGHDDRLFGLGESVGGFNKRGKKYVLYATDNSEHTPEAESLYSSHPFFIIDGPETFGCFIDYPSRLVFDVGFTDREWLEITVETADFDVYVIETPRLAEIVREFLRLTGMPYVPPRWAWGYQQCRWSYPSEARVREIARKFRELHIPCDAIYLDIDYMEHFKVFTVDRKKFPNFEAMVRELADEGFKLVPIIDPGVKIEHDYRVYEEGIRRSHFCLDEDEDPYTAACWPGVVHFPDFLNADTRRWWGKQYKAFMDMGIAGFWNDMNEPAIFYTPGYLHRVFLTLSGYKDFSVHGAELSDIRKMVYEIPNNPIYYKEFFHRRDDDESPVNHHLIHNLYGTLMAQATAEALMEHSPGRRHFLLSRSSYIGMHRYSAIWMGDNASWWEHMRLHIRMLMALNMTGFFYTGADVGGFGHSASPEMLIRWMQLGAFTPLYRNHSAQKTRNQEPWSFAPSDTEMLRDVIRLRYAFLPYAYSEFMRAVRELRPFAAPLMLYFPGDVVKDVEDQYMYGESLMVAPILEMNARHRFVHLPQVRWLEWLAERWDQRERLRVLEPGHHLIEADLSQIPLFLRENALIALREPVQYVGEREPEELTVIGLVTERADWTYYEDDGETTAWREGAASTLRIKVERRGTELHIAVEPGVDERAPLSVRRLQFEIYDADGRRFEKRLELAK